MSDDMVERSAKAIGRLNFPEHSWGDQPNAPALNEYQREMYRGYAKVVMQEIADMFAAAGNSSLDLAADEIEDALKSPKDGARA